MKEYAVYKGECLLAMGTDQECAKHLGVKPETIRWYTSPAYQRRLQKRKASDNVIQVLKIEDDE